MLGTHHRHAANRTSDFLSLARSDAIDSTDCGALQEESPRIRIGAHTRNDEKREPFCSEEDFESARAMVVLSFTSAAIAYSATSCCYIRHCGIQ